MATPSWDLENLIARIENAFRSEGIAESWGAEKSSVQAAIQALSSTLGDRYAAREVLGVGGSGITIRLNDHLFPLTDCALKFPRPLPGQTTYAVEMLQNEISHLSQLVHPHIVGIRFYSLLPNVNGYGTLPFYIMDAVNGDRSDHYAHSDCNTEEDFIALVKSTAQIIAHLHGHAFLHLDLKPENFIVASGGRATLIDLGSCKYIRGSDGMTHTAYTPSYAHPDLLRQLNAEGKIKRSLLKASWDLWAYGRTLLTWLGVDFHTGENTPSAAYDALTSYTRKYLLLIAVRLITAGQPSWVPKQLGLTADFLNAIPIASAAELCETIRRISVSSGDSFNLPELRVPFTGTIQAGPGKHVAKTERVKAVLEHRLFRRLNSITQLGFVSQVYPGAKHTRREHSLGTYANAISMFRFLWDDPVSPLFRQIVSEQGCRNLLLSSLLHDLGQFPFGHEFEDIDQGLFDHTDLTASMLRGIWRRKLGPVIRFEPLDEIFRIWGTTAAELEGLLTAKPDNPKATPLQKVLRSILNGPIDADKLDYLFRDAIHTDVPYPSGIDVDRLFRCLTTVVVEKFRGQHDIPLIGIHAKGKVAAEFMSVARYAMFSQVYWHHSVRAQKAMLFRAVQALVQSHEESGTVISFLHGFFEMVHRLPETLYSERSLPGTTSEPTLEWEQHPAGSGARSINAPMSGLGTDFVATDAAVLNWLQNQLLQLRRPESILVYGLLTRRFFKRVWEITAESNRSRWESITEQWDRLKPESRRRVALEFESAVATRLLDSNPARLADTTAHEISDRISRKDPWLVVDIPGRRPGAEVGLRFVPELHGRKLRRDNRIAVDTFQSNTWKTYAEKLREQVGIVRIFADPSLCDALDDVFSEDRNRDIDLGLILEEVIEQLSSPATGG
jgi:serine/threonine protein kinase